MEGTASQVAVGPSGPSHTPLHTVADDGHIAPAEAGGGADLSADDTIASAVADSQKAPEVIAVTTATAVAVAAADKEAVAANPAPPDDTPAPPAVPAGSPGRYHPSEFIATPDPDAFVPASAVTVTAILGLDSFRRNSLALIADDVIITASGSSVILLDLKTMAAAYLHGLDGGGIGAVAVNPRRTAFAVAEKCRHRSPNVYVYTYPGCQLVAVLRGGTERGYSALAWDPTGEMLASVGGCPDFLLTLWQWRTEGIVLRSKAFSQEVYTLRFSPHFDGFLTTSGTGHIRFWKMASTFTGLKLQGAIGKFGNVGLTDVAAFVELPDGKVLSGTETGELLLWDGGLIKVVLTGVEGRPCHTGAVEVLLHDAASDRIVSAGADGVVRLWDFHAVNDAEADEDTTTKAIVPVAELCIAPGARVRDLICERHRWIVLDDSGALYRVDLGGSALEPLSQRAAVTQLSAFHAGGLAGLVLLPSVGHSHQAVTAGLDGSLRVWDCSSRSLLHTAPFPSSVTAFATLPLACDPSTTVLLAGYADGVVRAVARASDGLRLLAVYKPHKASVTAIAISQDGSQMASTAADGTVFFFDITPAPAHAFTLSPRAFTALASPITAAAWCPGGRELLVGHRDGTLSQLPCPPEGTDVSTTYQLPIVPDRVHTLKLPIPARKKKPVVVVMVAAKEDADADGDGADGRGKEGAASKGAATAETDTPADADAQADQGPDEMEPVPEAEAGEEKVPMEILTLQFPTGDSSDTFLVTAGGRAAGHVWSVTWGAERAVPVLASFPDATTTFYATSHSRRFALLGSSDGRVRVTPVHPTPTAQTPAHGRPAAAGRPWEGSLHDMDRGSVAAVALSADDSYLLSAGRDGSLYTCAVDLSAWGMDPGPLSTRAAEEGAVSQLDDLPAAPADIVDPEAYSVEEEKQKAEKDAMARAAEEKKLGVREQLALIRAEFEELLAENAARPEAERLPRSEFEMDPGLREAMEAEACAQEAVAAREMAWEGERRRVGLAKLRGFFLGGVEVERVVVHALAAPATVATFRTARLSPAVQEELAEMRSVAAAAHEAATAPHQPGAAADSGQHDPDSGVQGGPARGGPGCVDPSKAGVLRASEAAAPPAAAAAAAAAASHTGHKPNKSDLRRLARKKREAEWAAFQATQPDEHYEAPGDVQAIQQAERTTGDFKLKSDPSFVLPEEERMTPGKKRRQLLLLEEAIHDAKMAFNTRLLALRDVKRKVISEIGSKVADLIVLNAQLGIDELPMLPVMLPDEIPESREEVSEEDLADMARRQEEEEARAAGGGALGGFSSSSTGPGGAPGTAAKKTAAAAAPAGAASHGSITVLPSSGSTKPAPAVVDPAAAGVHAGEEALRALMAAVPQSDLEKALALMGRRRLEFRRAKLLADVAALKEAFDEALCGLRSDKLTLEGGLKAAEMRCLVGVQELAVLREADTREVVLLSKRQAKLDDRRDITTKVCECSDKVEARRAELEELMARRATVTSDFESLVPITDPYREQLSRMFLRKIKRSRKTAGGGEAAGDSDEDDGGDGGDEDPDEEDDGVDEVCPVGANPALYLRVGELREKRLDQEDLITEFSKSIELLKKDKESLSKKQRLLETVLSAVNAEIDEFQREKQGRLNQIDVVVSLPLSAIEYLVDGRMPTDLSAALVFGNGQLARLKSRTDELEAEKAELRLRQKELKRTHVALLRDKAAKEVKVRELEQRALDVQMLKFGQVIDLELLDRVGSTQGTEELKEELREQEVRYARELTEWDARIAGRTDELMALTRHNTAALNAVSELTAAQRRLEGGPDRHAEGHDPVQQRRAEVEERDGLVALVNSQAADIELLKSQVGALRRKDTSVYA
ncbi:MAG: hypothetical protein WDW36_007418 [Sanguina aurantia]